LIFLTFHGPERMDEKTRHHLHESPRVMTVPLAILAICSVIAGYVGLPAILGEKADLFKRFLEPVIRPSAEGHLSLGTEGMLILASVAAALVGIFVAYLWYLRNPRIPHAIVAKIPWLYRILYNKYYVDEMVGAVIVNPLIQGSEWIYGRFDIKVIDGAINGSASAAGFFGRALSRLQTGFLKDYALVFLLGVAIILGVLLY
jgi:NADH-quinone oxidoreductase subunit L